MVVSNPPYIAEGDQEVEASVRGWEPADALFAGPDGLDSLREVVGGAPRWLAPGGALVCEIGAGQAAAVLELAADGGLSRARVEADLAGRGRFLVARR
jgi:release factor glutamine methyltransferase